MDKMWIRNCVRKHETLTYILKYLRIPFLMLNTFQKEQNAIRYKRTGKTKYEELATLKGKYAGKRCFIVATGPSLTVQDLDKLFMEHEFCFSVNSIVTVFTETKWRPDIYALQDFHAYEKFKKEILDYQGIKIFGSVVQPYCSEKGVIYFPQCWLNHYGIEDKMKNISKLKYKFSDCAPGIVYDGFSITYSVIQIAVFLGFKDIYLLGLDCNYATDHPYFNKSSVREKNEKHNSTDLMICAFEEAKRFCESKGIHIYNATRGGKLEVFPRVDFDTLFGK